MNITEMVKAHYPADKWKECCMPESFLHKDRVRIAIMCDLIEQMDTKIQQLEKRIEYLETFRKIGF